MTALEDLTLKGGLENTIEGEIPVEIGNLSNLKVLNLSFNNITGSIPVELGNLSNLTELILYNTKVTGSIPAELGNLTKLTRLALNSTKLTGEIPTELGNLTNLTSFGLDRNGLTGSIPASLGNLTNLTIFALDHNGLTGSIPASLGNLTNLTMFSVEINKLSGTLPASLGNLSELEYFYLGSNNVEGEIPAELGNLSKLKQLYISNNALTGKVPKELSKLSNLEWLYLSGNNLEGSLPEELSLLTNLTLFYYRSNIDLCEPQSSKFQNWLSQIESVSNSGVVKCNQEQEVFFTQISTQKITETHNSVELNAPTSSGLPVTFILEEGDGVIEGNILKFNDSGVFKVTAIQEGSDLYQSSSATITFTVEPSVSFSNITLELNTYSLEVDLQYYGTFTDNQFVLKLSNSDINYDNLSYTIEDNKVRIDVPKDIITNDNYQLSITTSESNQP